MLKGDGNKNGNKINRLISKKKNKNKFDRAAHFFPNQRKNKFARAARFFVFLCRCFSRLQCRIVRLKRKTYQLHIIFMEELSYVFPKILFPVFTIAIIFSLPLIFTKPLTFVNFLTAAMKFSCLSFNEIRLPGSFSVVHVSLNIKNIVKKTRLCCCCFFLSKSPGGHAIFFSCIWVAIPVD